MFHMHKNILAHSRDLLRAIKGLGENWKGNPFLALTLCLMPDTTEMHLQGMRVSPDPLGTLD